MLRCRLLCALILLPIAAFAQPGAALLSEPGPTFRIGADQLPEPLSFITYGDQRFTDPSNTNDTDPRVRQWLAGAITAEKPSALIVNGDIPFTGSAKSDYAVYLRETKPWRDAGIRVFPALGNHEFRGDPQQCLENWWDTFPELRNRRWYSVQFGPRIYIITLDTNLSLLPGSAQALWLTQQIQNLAPSVDFVVLSMHHPPVSDVQQHIEVNHNPRPNETAVRDYLTLAAAQSHARFLVSAGHIHNYERNTEGAVTYLVSGGGGAKPVYVERTPGDQYTSALYPNYHYVKLTLSGATLHGTMYRVENPEAATLSLEVKDNFDIVAKPRGESR